MDPRIRPYQADDYQTLLDLTLRAWKPVFEGLASSMSAAVYQVLVPDWQAEQRRTLQAVCGPDGGDLLVAEMAGKVVGFVAVRLHPEDFLGEIYMLGVDPDHQRQGIGSALSAAALDLIRKQGFTLAMVETGGDPGHYAARATYEKLGFELSPVARYFKRI